MGTTSWKAPSLSLYNWMAQEWVRLPEVNMNVPLEADDPARFLDPATNVIRLRAESGGMPGAEDCLEYNVGIRGTLAEESGP